MRSQPPIDRPERNHPEYADIFPALLAAPGVVLTTNSKFAARRYASWLGIAEDRIHVIYNGVAPLPDIGAATSMARLAEFDAATSAGPVIGTVLRFDLNKRPLLWIECAARFLRRRPDARFIMVGDGPMREEAEACARLRGLGGRVLFVGRVRDVGFWLSRMDAFLLTSRCEGLPNVLLEAQLAGVPVVTTPAGGAGETILSDRAGHVLACAETPDPEEAAAHLERLMGKLPTDVQAGVATRFSVVSMMEQTIRCYCAG